MVRLGWTDAERKLFRTTRVVDDIEQASYHITHHSGDNCFKVSWYRPYNQYSPPVGRLRAALLGAFWNMEYKRRFGI